VVAANLIYSANRIPEISDTIVEIDNSMKWGYNFEMGPFESWDAIGVAESVAKMEADGMAVPSTRSKRCWPPATRPSTKPKTARPSYYDFASESYKEVVVSETMISLAALKGAGKEVKSCASASLIDLGDGVFCCEFHTKMNALNGEIITFMDEALDYVDENGVGMVLGNQAGGMPGAFSAGADLTQVAAGVKEDKLDEVDAMIKALTPVQKERYCPFPVVAAPFGLALGGGCEVCLAADRIVAHSELYMGLVEIGVGLLPAGGGCMNLWKKMTAEIPAAVTDTDLAKFFHPHLHGHRHGQGVHVRGRSPRQRLSGPQGPHRLQPRLPHRRSQERGPQDGGRGLRRTGQETAEGAG
jgi:3-hydroxyacyl-CoA dehydrogenase